MHRPIEGLMFCIAMLSVGASAQTVSGSGYIGTIPVFTGSSTVGNSPITVSAGNVGIGTTTPDALLDLSSNTFPPLHIIRNITTGGNLYGTALYELRTTNPGVNGNGAAFYFKAPNSNNSSTNTSTVFAGLVGSGLLTTTAGSEIGFIGFNPAYQGSDPGNGTYGLTIVATSTTTSNVGIGTTAPGAKLEVNGNVKVDGDISLAGSNSNSITFPDGTVQTTAYQASSPGSDGSPLQVETNAVVINGGISASGSGLKHISTNTSCQTYKYDWNFCKISITWPGTPFADTNYDVVCTPKTGALGNGSSAPQGILLYVADEDKTTTSVNVTVQIGRTNDAGGLVTISPGISCIAIHD
jgi:hypothetical protein